MTDMTINEETPKQRYYRDTNSQVNNRRGHIIDKMRNDK
jgi:hypothetical protein